MDNDVAGDSLHQVEVATIEETIGEAQDDLISQNVQSPSGSGVPSSVKLLIRSLIDRYELTKEQFVSIYDEYMSFKVAEIAPAPVDTTDLVTNGTITHNSTSQGACDEEVEDMREEPMSGGEGEEQIGEVDKMQTLVKTAIESYETSPAVELGQKRKSFSLEEELNMKPTSFAQELLERDQTLVAQAIKQYMNQYSIPQREVVEKTSLNQSHLSQHFLHGVTMKRSKRIKLYHWFEEDQQLRTGKLVSADGSLSSVLDSPKVEGTRRRPRWKWSPISTQILTEAFKKNHFPTRDQRLELARVCNEAEVAMNNGHPIRGPEGDTEGITEHRVNTWFTNRRKGIATPSPTMADGLVSGASSVATPSSATTLFPPSLPPLLKAVTPVSPPTRNMGSNSPRRFVSEGERSFSIIPANIQSLVSQIQQAQAMAGLQQTHSQMQLATTPTQPFSIAIALPQGHPGTAISPSSTHGISSPHHPPSIITSTPQTKAVPTIISPTQLQVLMSQFQSTSTATTPPNFHITTPTNTLPVITIPAAAAATMLSTTSSAVNQHITTPTQVQTITVAESPMRATEPLPAFKATEQQVISSFPTLASNQVQALVTQLQNQAKMQGTPQLQINPGSAIPFAITLPGVSNEELARAIMLTAPEPGGGHS